MYVVSVFQEMLKIMKSIYDMMGKYVYPSMHDDIPREHVEHFFQVNSNTQEVHFNSFN